MGQRSHRGNGRRRALFVTIGHEHVRIGAASDDSTITRLGKRVHVMGDCWVVDGQPDVYPSVKSGWSRGNGHRFVYQEVHGVVLDPSIHVHHTCENKGCIRPDHLVAVEAGDHMRVHAGTALLEDVAISPDAA